MHRYLVALALMSLAPAAHAQDSTAVRALAAHAYPFDLVGGRLQGAGADTLFQVAKASEFLLVGEDHGIRELPARAASKDGKLKGLDAKVKRLLLSFDGVVMIPEGHASGLLVGP